MRREELADTERAEAELIGAYLPAELGDDELGEIVRRAIAQAGAESPRDIGRVMPVALAAVAGRADGRRVSERVREALAEATRSKATIIIAHRLSSLMHADEIILLEEGRIVERGTHAELLAMGGEYFDLYSLQTRTEQGLSVADAKIRRKVTEAAE